MIVILLLSVKIREMDILVVAQSTLLMNLLIPRDLVVNVSCKLTNVLILPSTTVVDSPIVSTRRMDIHASADLDIMMKTHLIQELFVITSSMNVNLQISTIATDMLNVWIFLVDTLASVRVLTKMKDLANAQDVSAASTNVLTNLLTSVIEMQFVKIPMTVISVTVRKDSMTTLPIPQNLDVFVLNSNKKSPLRLQSFKNSILVFLVDPTTTVSLLEMKFALVDLVVYADLEKDVLPPLTNVNPLMRFHLLSELLTMTINHSSIAVNMVTRTMKHMLISLMNSNKMLEELLEEHPTLLVMSTQMLNSSPILRPSTVLGQMDCSSTLLLELHLPETRLILAISGINLWNLFSVPMELSVEVVSMLLLISIFSILVTNLLLVEISVEANSVMPNLAKSVLLVLSVVVLRVRRELHLKTNVAQLNLGLYHSGLSARTNTILSTTRPSLIL